MYYVLNDNRAKAREAFVAAEDEIDDLYRNYSGYYAVDYFDSKKEAEQFCESFNLYEGEPDIELWCCSRGCQMTAYDYAHSGDGCVYEGQGFDDDDDDMKVRNDVDKDVNKYLHKVRFGDISISDVPDSIRNQVENALPHYKSRERGKRRERTPRRN